MSVSLRLTIPLLGHPGAKLGVVLGRHSTKVRARFLYSEDFSSASGTKDSEFLFHWLHNFLTLRLSCKDSAPKTSQNLLKGHNQVLIWGGCPKEILPIHSSRVSKIFPSLTQMLRKSEQIESMHFIILVFQIFLNWDEMISPWGVLS